MTTTTITRAGPADLDALAQLFDAYRQFYGQAPDIERSRKWLRERLRFGESMVLLARRGNALVGFVQLYPMFSSVRTAKPVSYTHLDVYKRQESGWTRRTAVSPAAKVQWCVGVPSLDPLFCCIALFPLEFPGGSD